MRVEGAHLFTQSRAILSIYKEVLEMSTLLKIRFLAQTQETQKWLADQAVFGIYEGIHPKLKKTMHQWLESEMPKEEKTAHFKQLLKLATQDVENTQHSVAKQIANFVKNVVERRSDAMKKQKPMLNLEVLGRSAPNSRKKISNLMIRMHSCMLY